MRPSLFLLLLSLTLLRSVFKIDQYLPDAWKPTFESYKTQLVELLARTGIIHLPAPNSQSDRPGPSFFPFSPAIADPPAELARARTAHANIVEEIKDVRKKVEGTEEALGKDWGREWEWKKLDGTCVEKDLGE